MDIVDYMLIKAVLKKTKIVLPRHNSLETELCLKVNKKEIQTIQSSPPQLTGYKHSGWFSSFSSISVLDKDIANLGHPFYKDIECFLRERKHAILTIKKGIWKKQKIRSFMKQREHVKGSFCENPPRIYNIKYKQQCNNYRKDYSQIEDHLLLIPNSRIIKIERTHKKIIEVCITFSPFFQCKRNKKKQFIHTPLLPKLEPLLYRFFDFSSTEERTLLHSPIFSLGGHIDVLLLLGYSEEKILQKMKISHYKYKKHKRVLQKRGWILTKRGLENPPKETPYIPKQKQIIKQTQLLIQNGN